jgi:Flp pilus assembly pilin Flp
MTDGHATEPSSALCTEAGSSRRRGERGQGLVEYAFIVMLIATALLVAVQLLGGHTATLYTNISNGLHQAGG